MIERHALLPGAGNHDPVEPYDDNEAGKNDLLTHEDKEQKIFATGNPACIAKDPTVICTDQIMEEGTERLMTKMAEFGFMPNKAELLWETPFSTYSGGKYWPCEMKEAAMALNGKQMLILSQLQTRVTLAQLKDAPGVVPLTAACAAAGTATGAPVAASTLATDWLEATARADKLATAAGLRLDDFAAITAYDFYGDFHRTVYAGELALRDMGQQRVNQYKLLMAAFPATPAAIVKVGDKPSDQNPVHVPFQNQFKQVFAILKGLGSAKPSDHFTVDLKGKKVSNASNNGLSFN